MSNIEFGGELMKEEIEKRSVKIPTIVWDINMKCKRDAELNIIFEYILEEDVFCDDDMSDYAAMENAVECEYFALNIGDECYKSEIFSVEFEIALESICKQLSGKYYLCNCYGCMYSDYSPYGNGSIGGIFCFVDVAEIYLRVNGKYSQYLEDGQCTIWDAFDAGGRQCYETEMCKQFKPRVGGLGGYRGQIYT